MPQPRRQLVPVYFAPRRPRIGRRYHRQTRQSRPPFVENRDHRIAQRGQVEGLRDECIRAGLQRPALVVHERVGGEGDDDCVRRAGIRLQAARGLPAVDAGHRQVHENDCRRPQEGQPQGLRAVRGGHDAETAKREVLLDHLASVGEIVDDEHVAARFHKPTVRRRFLVRCRYWKPPHVSQTK